jgi:hypothetical protein
VCLLVFGHRPFCGAGGIATGRSRSPCPAAPFSTG